MKKHILSALLFVFGFTVLVAQDIEPPKIACVVTLANGDVEITWQNPSVSCGVFNSHDLYVSSVGKLGPYTLLSNVTVGGTTSFIHTGANGSFNTLYYFMTSNYSCPGFAQITGDTLDNLLPEIPILDLVTVTPFGTEVNWFPSPSPETYGYIVYYYLNGNAIPIDTVIGKNNTTYLDISGNVDTGVVFYTIAAIDSCLLTTSSSVPGLFGDIPHKTIFLQTDFDRCTRELNLDWTDYINWPLGVKSYELLVEKNFGSIDTVGSFNDTTFTTTYADFLDGDRICFQIRAVRDTDSVYSYSNNLCIDFSLVRSPRFTYIRNATVSFEDNDITFEWVTDSTGDITFYEVYRSESSQAFEQKANQQVLPPVAGIQQYQDFSAEANQQTYSYNVITRDSCGYEDTSNLVQPVYLKVIPRIGLENSLTWTPFIHEFATIKQYIICRFDENDLPYQIGTVSPGTTSFVDRVEDGTTGDGRYCYAIKVEFTGDFPDGSRQRLFSNSNRECSNQSPRMFVPNAVAPEGVNNQFKPVLLFANNQNYAFKIFDRWGKVIFETNTPDEAWNGRFQGKVVPQGVYPYFIQFTGENKIVIQKKGTVMVVR